MDIIQIKLCVFLEGFLAHAYQITAHICMEASANTNRWRQRLQRSVTVLELQWPMILVKDPRLPWSASLHLSHTPCRKGSGVPSHKTTASVWIRSQSLWGSQERMASMDRNRFGKILPIMMHEETKRILWRDNGDSCIPPEQMESNGPGQNRREA
mmetsp:Transcript_10462/g.63975  ORF Transcript_10462/g.63975 Transcript_10462/m.63975 type:complete len:155 (-) Transcript_10462:2299-2763(-)